MNGLDASVHIFIKPLFTKRVLEKKKGGGMIYLMYE